MKSRMNPILCVGIALVAAVAAHAQTATANVPFSYHMGNRLLPAGTYHISDSNNGRIAWFRGKGIVQTASTIDVAGSRFNEPARLIFHKYGGEYFLSEIWAGGGDGHKLVTSEREKEISRGGALPKLAVVRLAMHN